jgi:hypothetical protein
MAGKIRRCPERPRVIGGLRSRPRELGLAGLAIVFSLLQQNTAHAQTAADINAVVGNICAVLSGQRRPNGRTLQYLLLMDEDFADPNPVALAVNRGVVHQCPRAYLAYEQRKRTGNPFAHSGLVKGSGVPLVTSAPKTFALSCRGGRGIASAQGSTLIVAFARGIHPAAQGLGPGQCSWADRVVKRKEPARIVVPLASAAQARDGATQINAGGTWTFQVYAANGSLRATSVAKGVAAKS